MLNHLKPEYPKMVLSHASFRLEGDYSDPQQLEDLARRLFHEWQGVAVEHITLEDYGLSIILEEGSLEGHTRVLAYAGIVYAAIAGYGSFRSGIDYLIKDGMTAANAIRSKAPLKDEIERSAKVKFTADAGVLSDVEGILKRVRLGQLDPHEGRVLIVDLLESYGEIPDETVTEIDSSLKDMPKAGKQLSIEVESVPRAASRKSNPRKQREPKPSGAHWMVEVSTRSRKEKPTIERKRTK